MSSNDPPKNNLSPESNKKQVWLGLFAGAVVFIIIGTCSGRALNSNTGSSAAPAAPAQQAHSSDTADTPAPNEHDLRQQAQDFWNGVMTPLSFAGEYTELAGKAESAGDAVTAQQYLSKAQDYVDKAGQGNLNAPDDDDWSTISNKLNEATFAYKSAIGKAKD